MPTLKIHERRINNDVSSMFLLQVIEQFELTEAEKKEFFSPIPDSKGRYVTSEATLDRYIDPRIFRETQLKRLMRWLATTPPILRIMFNWLFVKVLKMKLAYFDQNETHEQIYKNDPIQKEVNEGFVIHNLGHATQLIQTEGMNILTDPALNDLAPLIYPSMTKGLKQDITVQQIPRIDAILISHNHRDHVDEKTLKQLIKFYKQQHWALPKVYVPQGDEKLFESMGFKEVQSFEWHEQITLTSVTNKQVTFCSTPADHRSGRNGFDAHHSLITGWSISPKERPEIVYFAGDTARISQVRLKSLAMDICHLLSEKTKSEQWTLPKIINMEPGGPNYTRKDMQPTHQSGVDSIISTFRLAIELNKVGDKMLGHHVSAKDWLEQTATLFIHHNKYELGPDRFNENVFIFNRLISYLKMDSETLEKQRTKQNTKNKHWSLFHRSKTFIIDGVDELLQLGKAIWPDASSNEQKKNIIQFLEARTHFPLVQEKVESETLFQFKMGEKTTIMPQSLDTTKGKLKGEKRLPQPEVLNLDEPRNRQHNPGKIS